MLTSSMYSMYGPRQSTLCHISTAQIPDRCGQTRCTNTLQKPFLSYSDQPPQAAAPGVGTGSRPPSRTPGMRRRPSGRAARKRRAGCCTRTKPDRRPGRQVRGWAARRRRNRQNCEFHDCDSHLYVIRLSKMQRGVGVVGDDLSGATRLPLNRRPVASRFSPGGSSFLYLACMAIKHPPRLRLQQMAQRVFFHSPQPNFRTPF